MDTLKHYYLSLNGEQRREISAKAGTNPDYFYQVCRGQRKPSPKLAKELEKVTKIPKFMWRPDIWDSA